MDHWWVEASGIAEHFTPAEVPGEPEIFQLELRTGDDRTIRIKGHRSLLKHTRRPVTQRDVRRLGGKIADITKEVTGADLRMNALDFDPKPSFGDEPVEAGTFWLELKTHGDRTIRIEGDRKLFQHTHPQLVTDLDVRQFGEKIVRAVNYVTGELELGGSIEI